MQNTALALILLGISSFIFKMMNPPRQSLIMSIFGPYERAAAFVCLGIGAGLFLWNLKRKAGKTDPKTDPKSEPKT